MNTVLLPHQQAALHWMSRRENGSSQPIGGILADDQGLGKTVTTISLIACNPRNGIQRVDIPPEGSNSNGGADGNGAGTSAAASAAAAVAVDDGGTKEEEIVIVINDDDECNDDVGIEAEGCKKSSKVATTAAASEQEDLEIIEEAGAAVAITAAAKSTMTAPPVQPRPEFGTLVVCPTTLLHQWQSEVRTKSQNVHAYIYHGKSKGVSIKVLAQYDVVITTYQTLVLEMPETKKPPAKKGSTSNLAASVGRQATQPPTSSTDTSFVDLVGQEEEKTGKKRKRDPLLERGGPLFSVMWHRVVLDEAQMIKNPKTMASHAAWALRARRRWCLSGTPIQNSVDDLYSYFKFLRYEPYSNYSAFKQLIKDPVEGDDPQGFNRLKVALRPILIRRTKDSKDKDGNKIFPLPDRNVRLIKKEFSPEERDFYMKLKADAEADIAHYQNEGGPAGNYFNVLFKVLRMRQACNHPKLVRNKSQNYSAGGGGGRMSTAETNAVEKLKDDLKIKLAETLRTGLTECAICFDMPEDPVVSLCNHVFCRQCVSSKFSMAGQGAAEAELAFHCPTCGHALGDNQTFGASALHVVDGSGAGGSGTSNVPTGRSDGSSTKIDALIEVLLELRKPIEEPPLRSKAEGGLVIKNISREHLKDEVDRLNGSSQQAQNRKRVQGGKTVIMKPPLRQKVIVFSQWTSMLDLIEDPLTREEIEFRRLDGTMTASARQAAIQHFTERPEVSVMLASLKAASLGVNLVSANHVVLMDLWFNPSTEEQAIDRAHRIGQINDVEVTRITIKDSIEDKILELQDKKRELTDKALEGKGGKLTRDEMLSLFGVGSGGGGIGGASGSGGR
jgi:SNF2 family DNA or RNA helicase